MRRIVFYISGHGFGHSVRCVEIMSQLFWLCPETEIQVRTTAPPQLFRPLPQSQIQLTATSIDSGVVEESPLRVDVPATLARVQTLFARRAEILESEYAFVRQADPHLILADIPYLAGSVAQATGRDCVAIGNFTWDWIYEPYFADHTARDLSDFIAAAYARMDRMLQLPFGHPVQAISHVVQLPLVARRSAHSPETLRCRLGLEDETRPVVLIGMRGTLPEPALIQVAEESRDLVFLYLQDRFGATLENLRHVALDDQIRFPDVLCASDAVVSKLGYGMVADAIANRTRILWPARAHFREDEVLGVEVPQYTPSLEIPVPDFNAGHWGDHLQTLLSMPDTTQDVPLNGGEVAARHILEMLSSAGNSVQSQRTSRRSPNSKRTGPSNPDVCKGELGG